MTGDTVAGSAIIPFRVEDTDIIGIAVSATMEILWNVHRTIVVDHTGSRSDTDCRGE